MTPDDPNVSQVREVRDKHAVQFAYDLERIFRDIREKQRSSGRKYVRYSARRSSGEQSQLPARS